MLMEFILKGQQTDQANGVDKDRYSQSVVSANCSSCPTYKMHPSTEKLPFFTRITAQVFYSCKKQAECKMIIH